MVSGEGLSEFEYHGNGTQRRMKYNLANLALLDQDIREAQAQCAASLGLANPGRRFALTAGPKPDGCPAARWSARLGYY